MSLPNIVRACFGSHVLWQWSITMFPCHRPTVAAGFWKSTGCMRRAHRQVCWILPTCPRSVFEIAPHELLLSVSARCETSPCSACTWDLISTVCWRADISFSSIFIHGKLCVEVHLKIYIYFWNSNTFGQKGQEMGN